MKILSHLKYSTDHEWVRVEGNKAYIGITDYAQHSLGSIVFVQLPEAGAEMQVGDVLGVVESVKAASDILSPIRGKVVEINATLEDAPEKLNNEPFESWIAVMEISELAQLEDLLDAKSYEKHCSKEA